MQVYFISAISILPHFSQIVKKKGAPYSLPAKGWAGQGQLQNKAALLPNKNENPKAEKKSEPKRPVQTHFRRSEFSELQNLKNFLFLFEKKRGAQNLKNVEKIFLFWNANFFKVCGRKQAGRSLKVRIGIFRKKSSNFVQKAPQKFKIKIWGDCGLAPPGAELGFGQDFPSVFEIKIQSLLGDSEVRLSEAQSPAKRDKPIFFCRPLGDCKAIIYPAKRDCPKAILKFLKIVLTYL